MTSKSNIKLNIFHLNSGKRCTVQYPIRWAVGSSMKLTIISAKLISFYSYMYICSFMSLLESFRDVPQFRQNATNLGQDISNDGVSSAPYQSQR